MNKNLRIEQKIFILCAMKISGFSFARNAIQLYYPVVESIRSILPIVDEFVIAVGQSEDNTREAILSIGDPKIRIIDTVWDERHFHKGIVNAIQTDIAKNACTGDWLFYLQADEVVHEKYLPLIKEKCEAFLHREEVEGFLFRYKHFWGDYDHYQAGHGWYSHEIRIIRNRPDIHSWQSAQSFRRIDWYEQPRQPNGHHPLRVVKIDAEIYHYGWVRPPHLMQQKRKALDSVHWGLKRAQQYYEQAPPVFDYGPMDRLAVFTGTHPRVMWERIHQMNWKDQLQPSGKPNPARPLHKHERLKYRILTWIENRLLGGRRIGEFKNYRLIKVK